MSFDDKLFEYTLEAARDFENGFDKNPVVSGILQGIKGQYLIFDTGVINIRKFTSYEVSVDSE